MGRAGSSRTIELRRWRLHEQDQALLQSGASDAFFELEHGLRDFVTSCEGFESRQHLFFFTPSAGAFHLRDELGTRHVTSGVVVALHFKAASTSGPTGSPSHPYWAACQRRGLGARCEWRMARTSSHSVETQRLFEARSTDVFDRVAFALSLLAFLKPPMKVAVYPRTRHLEAARGGVSEPWAVLGIPPHATRANIVQAVVELVGAEDQPFLVDLLCSFR